MRIKRVEAPNAAEALRLVQRELGEHAVILHTRTLAPSGAVGGARRPHVEVLAAVDEPLAPSAHSSPAPSAGASRRASAIIGGPGSAGGIGPTPFAAPPADGADAQHVVTGTDIVFSLPEPGGPGFSRRVRAFHPEQLQRDQPARRPDTREPSTAESHPSSARAEVAERLARFRATAPTSALAGLLPRAPGTATTPAPEADPTAARGFSVLLPAAAPSAGSASTASAPAGAEAPARTGDDLRAIDFAVPAWERVVGRARRIAFVGPTGAGKTTTLAKVAAHAQLVHGKRVQLVTLDTYRIGAIPQLRSYADILGVPLIVVHSPDEMDTAMAQTRGADLVLIDTVGRSPLGDGVAGLVPFLERARPDEVHLVVSATTRIADAARAAASYARLGPNRLCVTKLDETDYREGIVLLAQSTGLPLSWLGTGQDVPDDLEAADAVKLGALLKEAPAA